MQTHQMWRECLATARAAAQEAGVLLRRHAGRPRSVRHKGSFIDLVTEVDRAAERLIAARIRRRFPGHAFLGEEATVRSVDARQSAYRWIVDPIDGTTNFVHGVPCFAVSIGVEERGRLIAGVVYDPMRREEFTAIAGGGAQCNGRRIHVSRARRLQEALLSTGFSPRFRKDPASFLARFVDFQCTCHAVRRNGSTAISLAYVAAGRFDGFWESDVHPWDSAAGILLVREAGGCVTDYHGRPATAENPDIVASNNALQHLMLRIVNRRRVRLRFDR